jgi:hypothetical protein
MVNKNMQAPPLPARIISLSFAVAKNYLEKDYWSQHEAVMMVAGHNPKCEPFYDEDEASEQWLARLIWRGVRNFYPLAKRLPVDEWLDWLTIGTNDHPRIHPIGFAPELKNARSRSKSSMKALEKALAGSNEEAPISAPEIRVKGAWRLRVQEAAFYRWCVIYAAGANPSVHGISPDMARWCVENNVKNDYNQHPTAGSIRNSVLNAKNWEPPRMSRENAKEWVSRTSSVAQVAQVAQVQK